MKSRHLTFSEMIELTQTKDRSSKIAHLDECERCLTGYAVAMALVSKSKESKEPVEIIIGDMTPALRNLENVADTSKPEVIGKADTIGVEMYLDDHGLNFQVVSRRYEIGQVKVKIYKRATEAKQLTALKSGVSDQYGFIRMRRIDKESMNDLNCQYLISVTGLLRPLQKRACIVPPTYKLI